MKILALFFAFTTLGFAALPKVGPDYYRPDLPPLASYRDAGGWKTADPADALPRGAWWNLFGDPVLDGLETRALAANQDLRAAAARVEQARAAAGIARGDYWPQLAAHGAVIREQTSQTTENVFPDPRTTTYRAPLTAAWELDLFGRVRRLNESARDVAAASEATFESVRLSLTADVAANYFALRATERELVLLDDTVRLRRRALELATARVRSGTAADLDAARAETELASTEAERATLANQRSALANALATLVGEPASGFVLAVVEHEPVLPHVPAGLPSELLERRPDIAAAERSLAAANARIGVAKAAFFPAISLTGSAGYASADIDRLTESDSRIWSIGPQLYLPIFQGGRNRANLARSRAAYDEAVAAFRQRVLVALREVQDALTASRLIGEEAAAQQRALESSRRAQRLAQIRYDAGYVSYLEVIDAQRTALATERATARLIGRQLATRVALIKALGGGWHAPQPGGSLAAR
ncbi:efflux transporter outer membrane subunit [Opitutus terrae]|uniref:RND efflux system, outer membrane lipoprotein, NodT family n=1 Tax=Opitutus terrae (strain DSM 11246 / JCM 15787 / PB90-1) TaxID=452637 RepID=B1ZYI8_OPITP|nr:efflux transporter outer membrane subunit [Opitutus terrae]ACB77086.1 RND efflux system, outer membrane lipoprotein, NodT family [Opitutus terrae PB90-1]